MIRFTNTIHIERPPEVVFDYVSDLAHTPEWNGAIAETVKTSPGPIAEGSTYRQTRRIPRQATENLEISHFEAPRRLEVEGILARQPARLNYEFAPHEGGTRLTNRVELQPQGPVRLLAPTLAGRVEAAAAENLATLKRHLETSG
ncbi:MAG: SRPBCC family protein [Acidimicrobiia bacterium]